LPQAIAARIDVLCPNNGSCIIFPCEQCATNPIRDNGNSWGSRCAYSMVPESTADLYVIWPKNARI